MKVGSLILKISLLVFLFQSCTSIANEKNLISESDWYYHFEVANNENSSCEKSDRAYVELFFIKLNDELFCIEHYYTEFVDGYEQNLVNIHSSSEIVDLLLNDGTKIGEIRSLGNDKIVVDKTVAGENQISIFNKGTSNFGNVNTFMKNYDRYYLEQQCRRENHIDSILYETFSYGNN